MKQTIKKIPKKQAPQKTLFDKVGIDPFVLVVALVLLFIASVFVFPNLSLSQKLFPTANSSNSSSSVIEPTVPALKGAGLLSQGGSLHVHEDGSLHSHDEFFNQGHDQLQAACVADLSAHGVQDAGHLSHCLIEYKEELESRPKTYGDACDSHEECPPSVVWTEDAHHGECPAASNFKCSLRCTGDSDCSFKTNGVLSSCCFECAGDQPFGLCVE